MILKLFFASQAAFPDRPEAMVPGGAQPASKVSPAS
jgi:hypothetical protein